MENNTMDMKVMTVTPEMAAEWLRFNDKNRTLRLRDVEHYANMIRNDEWACDGQTIKIAASGRLLDGQHRLSAVVKANKSIRTLVVSDLPEDAFKTLDKGIRRTLADTFGSYGNKNCTTLSSAVCLILRDYGNGSFNRVYGTKIKESECLRFLEENPSIADAVTEAKAWDQKTKGSLLSCATMAGVYWILRQINEKKATLFFYQLNSGADLTDGSPVLTLRNKLLTERKDLRLRRSYYLLMVSKAWNAYYKGKPLHRINIKDDEPMPVLEGSGILPKSF